MEKKCVFCGNPEIRGFMAGDRTYFRCGFCDGIFLDPQYRLEPENEKNRYKLHNNSLENAGYRLYLEKFLDSICSFPAIHGAGFNDRWKIFDYGSGPEPSFIRLLRERGFDARGRDPFFAPETPCFEGGADLVTCLEVAEHFAAPVSDFVLMAECVRSGGFLAVGTHLLSSLSVAGSVQVQGSGESSADKVSAEFASWWYRQDPTHISFYSEKALRIAAGKAGLEWLGQAAPHVYIFKKSDER